MCCPVGGLDGSDDAKAAPRGDTGWPGGGVAGVGAGIAFKADMDDLGSA